MTPAEQAALAAVSGRARLLRYGGDCYCYTQLAMGLVDVVIENGLQPYDVQALIPIVQAAGGVITELVGRALRPGRRRCWRAAIRRCTPILLATRVGRT